MAAFDNWGRYLGGIFHGASTTADTTWTTSTTTGSTDNSYYFTPSQTYYIYGQQGQTQEQRMELERQRLEQMQQQGLDSWKRATEKAVAEVHKKTEKAFVSGKETALEWLDRRVDEMRVCLA